MTIPANPAVEAGDSIRGYLYQFLRCVDLLLASGPEFQIVVEAFEDIAGFSDGSFNLIQVKDKAGEFSVTQAPFCAIIERWASLAASRDDVRFTYLTTQAAGNLYNHSDCLKRWIAGDTSDVTSEELRTSLIGFLASRPNLAFPNLEAALTSSDGFTRFWTLIDWSTSESNFEISFDETTHRVAMRYGIDTEEARARTTLWIGAIAITATRDNYEDKTWTLKKLVNVRPTDLLTGLTRLIDKLEQRDTQVLAAKIDKTDSTVNAIRESQLKIEADIASLRIRSDSGGISAQDRENLVENTFRAQFIRRYEPIRNAIESWRLVEVPPALQDLIRDVDETAQISHEAASALADLRQRMRISLANVYFWSGETDTARELWWDAKNIGSFSSERLIQAATVALNLGEVSEAGTLLANADTSDPEVCRILAILRWAQRRPTDALALIPEDTDDLDLINLRGRILVMTSEDETASLAVQALENIWARNIDSPIGKIDTAQLGLAMLQRIIESEWDAEGVDRRAFLSNLRDWHEECVESATNISIEFPGVAERAVASKLAFHVYLAEGEYAESCQAELQNMPSLVRERAVADLITDTAPPSIAALEELANRGDVSPSQRAVLESRILASQDQPRDAIAILRSYLALSSNPADREPVLGELIQVLTESASADEARKLLDHERQASPQLVAILRAMVASKVDSRLTAITILKGAAVQFPKSRIILQNLVRLYCGELAPSKEDSTDAIPRDDGELERAIADAEQLVELLPSPENEIHLAILLRYAGKSDVAVTILSILCDAGYKATNALWWLAQALLDLDRPGHAATRLESALEITPGNITLASTCATAWALAGEYGRAISRYESLIYREANSLSVEINLAASYMLNEPNSVDAANKAFELLKGSFIRNPDDPHLPARLVAAGDASGRFDEAMALVGGRDLSGNPYLLVMPADDALQLMRDVHSKLQQVQVIFDAGLIPFISYAHRTPRPGWYLWTRRMTEYSRAFDKGNWPAPLLVNLPSIADTPVSADRVRQGVVLEATAILTLANLGLLRQTIEALKMTGATVSSFPGCERWLREEILSLKQDQRPWHRDRLTGLTRLLQQSDRITLMLENPLKADLPSESLGTLGPSAIDYEYAASVGGKHVEDRLPAEAYQSLGSLVSSSDVLSSLTVVGAVFRDDANVARLEFPGTFNETPGAVFDLPEVVVMSEQTVLAWYDSGLLTRWASGQEGFPRLVIGAWAWNSINSQCAEAEAYREALERAQTAAKELAGCGVSECAAGETIETDEASSVERAWQPALSLLASAKFGDLSVCSDDLFTQQIVDRRGLLLDDEAIRALEVRLRERFAGVNVFNTATLLQYLARFGALEQEVYLRAVWSMWRQGYRLLPLDVILQYLLTQVPYRSKTPAAPYRRVLQELERTVQALPQQTGSHRRNVFGAMAAIGLATNLITAAWALVDERIPEDDCREFCDEVVAAVEAV